MSFEPSPRGADLRRQVSEFVDTVVVPAEPVYEEQMLASGFTAVRSGLLLV